MPAHYTSVLLKCWLCGFRTPPVLSIVIRWLIWVIRHIQGYHHKEESYASNIYKFQLQRTPVREVIGYVKHPKKSHCYSHPVRTTWFLLLLFIIMLQQHPAHAVYVDYSARARCRVPRLVVAGSCIACCGCIVVLRQYSGAAAAAWSLVMIWDHWWLMGDLSPLY